MVKDINIESIITNAAQIFHELRWGGNIACPHCGSISIYNPQPSQLHACKDCGHRFTDTSQTIFHSTKLPLHKHLLAIYFFVSSSKGISSTNLARMIGVSQKTAWKMLTNLRSSIQHDLAITDSAQIDEVYLGADWSKKPLKDKYKRCEPPKPVWNLKGKELKKHYTSQMLVQAGKDKIPILGICDNSSRNIKLYSFPSGITSNSVKSQINALFPHVNHWITDQSRLYWWMDDENSNIHHSICDHGLKIYISKDGFTTNRIEGAFAHLKRMYRGTYHYISRKYAPLYLQEFSWRFSNFDKSIGWRFNQLVQMCCDLKGGWEVS